MSDPTPETESLVPATTPVDSANASSSTTDLVQSVTKIDRAIKQRRDTDTILMNYWLYLFVVFWVTFGIYGIILFFKRINRIDGFSERKKAYYEGLLEWTERYARREGREDEVHHLVVDSREEIKAAYVGDLRPIGAGKSFLLTLVTLGIYGFIVLYRLNKYWWDAQLVEQEFDDKLSQAWMKLGLMNYPVNFTLDQSKRRSYPLYLILSIVTLGIWGIVWDYKIQTDPERLFPEYHSHEDSILQVVRAH